MGEDLHPAAEADTQDELFLLVPGFSGYVDPGNRRQADAQQREALLARLVHLKEPLTRLTGDLIDSQRLDLVAQVDRVRKSIEMGIGRIRFATEDYGEFFKAQKLPSDVLTRVYEFEAQLHQKIEDLDEVIVRIAEHTPDASGGRARWREAEARVEELDQALNQRNRILSEIA